MPTAENADAQSYYVLLRKKNTYRQIAGVTSVVTADVVVYDLDTYRDDLTGEKGVDSHQDNLATNPVNAPTSDLSDGIIQSSSGGDTIYTSISDVAAHIPPRYFGKKVTEVSFWSQAAGAGNLLYRGYMPYDIIDFGIGLPTKL